MRVAPPFDPDWDPADPHRTCYSCGAQPTGSFNDGSPSYGIDHPSHGAVKGPEGWMPPPPLDIDDLVTSAGGKIGMAVIRKPTESERKLWDFELKRGGEREDTFADHLMTAIGQDMLWIEVKSEVDSRTHIFIEAECYGKPSGIATTKAHAWTLEVAAGIFVTLPTDTLRQLCRAAYDERGSAFGGDATTGRPRGVVVPKSWILGIDGPLAHR
jgi:hypothetical protein